VAAYQFDIFLSYRRNSETLAWISRHFLPLLRLRVGLELGRDPVISVDDQIETGVTWPLDLANRLASSRVLVALLTKTYFHSQWCMQEMSLMLAREKETGRRTLQNPRGLVIPAVIHDGADFPDPVQRIQNFDIRDCFNVRMSDNSPLAEQLDDALKQEAPAIAAAISDAPRWQPDWPIGAATAIYDAFYKSKPPEQTTLPALA
jgi:hypothetical protein